MRPGMPDVVLRPRSASCTLTLGPAFVSVTLGARPPRAFPRNAGVGAWGAVARIRVHLVEEPLTPALPQMSRLSLVDGQGAVLVTLPWDGDDHEALEAACVATGIALDRVPDEEPDGVGRTVVLPAPTAAVRPRDAGPFGRGGGDGFDVSVGDSIDGSGGSEGPASEQDGAVAGAGASAGGRGGRTGRIRGWRGYRRRRRVTLVLGPREIAVEGVERVDGTGGSGGTADGTLRWPRLGCVGEYERAVARVRITLFAEQTVHDPDLLPGPPTDARQRVFGLTLLDVEALPIVYLQWGTYDLPELRRALAVAGLLPEFRWQPYGEAATLAQRGIPVVRTATVATGAVSGFGTTSPGRRSTGRPTDTGRADSAGRPADGRRSGDVGRTDGGGQSEGGGRSGDGGRHGRPGGPQRPARGPEQGPEQGSERGSEPGPEKPPPVTGTATGGEPDPPRAPRVPRTPRPTRSSQAAHVSRTSGTSARAPRRRVASPGAVDYMRDRWLYGAAVLVLLLLTLLVIALSR